jgi:hypothetical protein
VLENASHRLAEARSLELHRAVAARLRSEPELLERARERVAGWRSSGTVSEHYVEAWTKLLSAGVAAVTAALEEQSERAHDLRQSSPFAGVLDARTRWRIRREVREELERE